MFSKKNIVVTIGDFGAVVAFYEGKKIKSKFILDELSEASKAELKSLSDDNKSAPIYILLDNADQSYRKKTYPFVRKGDLLLMIKRDMAIDNDSGSLRSYIILNPKKSATNNSIKLSKRWECLFVSSTISQTTVQWIDFLSDLSNRLVGIYLLPVESFELFKALKSEIKKRSKIKDKKNDLFCFIVQNKTSGIRQVVFSDQGVVFTRIINYDAAQPDYLEKYEQDIYSTFEYLKRIFPDVTIKEIDIVNILPKELLDPIKNINNTELNFVNYTPFEASSKIKNSENLLSESDTSCDLLISGIFAEQKKILKFTTTKISALEKFFFVIRGSYYFNILLLLACLTSFVITVFSLEEINQSIDEAETKKFNNAQSFNKVQRQALEGTKLSQDSETKTEDIEKITDFGKVGDALGSAEVDFNEIYIKLKFIKDFNVKLDSLSYALDNFNSKSPVKDPNYKVTVTGKIFNKGGDIENLFKEFDSMSRELKSNFSTNQLKYSEIPRNVDFNQKYYSFPIDFSISKK